MKSSEMAAALFQEGFSCSQSVFTAFAVQYGLDRETALKIGGAFGGGMGRMGDTCGAVTGALMALGLKHAPVRPEDKDIKEQTYALARELAAQFKVRNDGYVMCRDLLGCPIDTPERLQAARDRKLFETLCPKFVRDAAEIAEQLVESY